MNILEELYHGNIRPNEKCFDRNSEYAAIIKIIAENEEKLLAFLNAQTEAKRELQLFSQLMNAQSEILNFSEQNRFIEGFQLGARFMLDSLMIPQQSVIRDI